MPKHKSIIIKTQWVIAGRVRKCYHSAIHQIVKGDSVLEVAEGMKMNGYCETCGHAMIAEAKKRLDELKPAKVS